MEHAECIKNRALYQKQPVIITPRFCQLQAGWVVLYIQSLVFPSDHLVCQKLPKKLFHMLHGSLLSINNFMYLNGRDQSVKFCLCSNSPLICPHQWDAVAGKRSLQVFQPAAYTGP